MSNYNRKNPWNYERAYFRYGFWDIPSGENEIFHATVKYSDILKSGSLSPRAFRESKEETLGGRHDVSTSFYGSIYHAMNTLLYLYRIWQLEHDFESIPFSEEEKEKVTNLRTSSNYNIREILRKISHKYFETLKDPIVRSHSWVADTQKEDFALITILNPCKYMYKQYLGSKYGKGSNFPMFESPAFEELANYVASTSYFNSNRGNTLPSGSSQSGIYHFLKEAISNSKTYFEYDFGLNYWTKEPLKDEALARAVFGERSYFTATDRFTIGKNLYQFENITIDLNPQSLPIEDICEFYEIEQEFRLFREIPVERFKDIYTIEDIIETATELNGGIEPLFWDFTKGESENYDLSKQKVATWEEERQNPYLESENGTIRAFHVSIKGHCKFDDPNQDLYAFTDTRVLSAEIEFDLFHLNTDDSVVCILELDFEKNKVFDSSLLLKKSSLHKIKTLGTVKSGVRLPDIKKSDLSKLGLKLLNLLESKSPDQSAFVDQIFEYYDAEFSSLEIIQLSLSYHWVVLGYLKEIIQELGFYGYYELEFPLIYGNEYNFEDFGFNICVFGKYLKDYVKVLKIENLNLFLAQSLNEERQNPYLESKNGKIVNPETNDIIWYHGSWFGKLDRLKAYNPRKYYDATYFSSSEKLANEFATGEMAWLGTYEEVPRLKRSGYLHFVEISDVKLLDSDKIFSDKEELLLTDEGAIFVQALSDLGVEDQEIEWWLLKLRKGRFHAFTKSDPIFPHLIAVMKKLGYRGWFEREFTKDNFESHINIALLYPDEDAKLVGGHIVKRTRKF